jgi:hypothetical protein
VGEREGVLLRPPRPIPERRSDLEELEEDVVSSKAIPTYDELLPSDLATLEKADHHTLAFWHWSLNSYRWPEELPPWEPDPRGTSLWYRETMPDRRDDIMEWIRNKVGGKYLLMIWQCEIMMQGMGVPELARSESDFEGWWNEPHPNGSGRTKGEEHLESAGWWARKREEQRAARKKA